MTKIDGRLLLCDRCGVSVFLRFIEKKEMDGGWTTWNQYEEIPEGWDSHFEIGDLCPECEEQYQEMIADFRVKKDAFMRSES